MNFKYRFDPAEMAKKTGGPYLGGGAYSADSYNSWPAVCRLLAQRGFNAYEAEAILRSKITRWARDEFGEGCGKPNTSGTLAKYLDKYKIKPSCDEVNELVFETFKDELGLELNDKGQPCHRGTMPGNPKGGTILVPLGTPLCCDPTSETYWSM